MQNSEIKFKRTFRNCVSSWYYAKHFILLLLFFISCNSGIGKVIKTKETVDVKVVLLGGQSNMAGAGNYEALNEELKNRIKKIAPRVLLSRDGNAPMPLSFYCSKFQENKRGFGNVFGPELFLGLTLAEEFPKQEFLFIKRSQGGTALYGAWNPEWTAKKAEAVEKEGFKRDLRLYKEHLFHIKEQLSDLEEANKSYEIIGMFWMQGENDAAIEIASRNYESNLKKLIAGYRSEFNVPELAFIIGQINSLYGEFSEGPEMVRNAIIKVANEDEYVTVVKTSMDLAWPDFPKHKDNVHYNHIGQMRLGIAFANKWMKMVEK